VRYLLDSYWPDRRIWPIRPTTSPDVPAAPWWKARDLEELIARFGGCLLNPRAEVLACLLEHRSLVPDGFIEPLVREVVDLAMAQPDAIEMHDLWCYTALGQSPGLDETLRRPLMEKLCRAAGVTVERDQSKWGGYCLKPLMLVRDPRSPFLAAVGQDLIEANIAYEIGRQTPAGSWEPHWDWGGQHPEVWERAKAAWTSILTEETLFVLRNFGRTPSAA
jgi:hypothetical protein